MKFSSGMRPMNHRQQSLFLILILAIVVLFVAGVTNYLLYDVAFEQNRERLVIAASNQARLIEAIAKHEVEFDKEENGLSDALQLVRDFYDEFEGFGETGEFVLARRQGEQIIFRTVNGAMGKMLR